MHKEEVEKGLFPIPQVPKATSSQYGNGVLLKSHTRPFRCFRLVPQRDDDEAFNDVWNERHVRAGHRISGLTSVSQVFWE